MTERNVRILECTEQTHRGSGQFRMFIYAAASMRWHDMPYQVQRRIKIFRVGCPVLHDDGRVGLVARRHAGDGTDYVQGRHVYVFFVGTRELVLCNRNVLSPLHPTEFTELARGLVH